MLNFPSNPIDGQQYSSTGRAWQFNASVNAWDAVALSTSDANSAAGSALDASNAKAKAQQWATKTDAEVEAGQGYGAKFYSNLAATTLAGKLNTADLNAPNTVAIGGFSTADTQAILDNALPMQSYTALRAYTGRASGVRITSAGLAGTFQRDAADTTSADNGGTVIVDAAGRRWKRLFDGFANARWFGVSAGGGSVDETAAFQLAFNSGLNVFIPRPTAFYRTTATLTAGTQWCIECQDELTEIRMTSGSGFVLKIDGGSVEGTAHKQIHISKGSFTGGDPVGGVYNTDCDGGIYVRGAYLVTLEKVHCKVFNKSTGIACLLENIFNLAARDCRFNCGTAKENKQGFAALKVTISAGSTWNITQVTINQCLGQFNGSYGLLITREGTTGSIDGIDVSNNGFGHNGIAGVAILTDQVSATFVRLNHIEGTGSYGIYIPNSEVTASLEQNRIQDAGTAIHHNGRGRIGENTIAAASATGDSSKIGISIGANANLKIGENNIDSTWVTASINRYVRAAGGRADFGVIQCTTAVFSSFYSANAAVYQGAMVIQTDATDYSSRFLVAYGVNWYRLVPRFSGVVTLPTGTSPNIGGTTLGAEVFKTANTGATLVAAIPGGYSGQRIRLIFGDANTTIDFSGTTLKGNGGVDFAGAIGDSMDCVYDGTNWYCLVGKA